MEELLGATEIAQLLGVTRQRVDQLARTDPRFPRPVAELAAGRIWRLNDIKAWAKQGRRRLRTMRTDD